MRQNRTWPESGIVLCAALLGLLPLAARSFQSGRSRVVRHAEIVSAARLVHAQPHDHDRRRLHDQGENEHRLVRPVLRHQPARHRADRADCRRQDMAARHPAPACADGSPAPRPSRQHGKHLARRRRGAPAPRGRDQRRNDPPVVEPLPGSIDVERPHDSYRRPIEANIGHGQRLGEALRFVVARTRPGA